MCVTGVNVDVCVCYVAAKGTLSEDTVRWFLRQAGHMSYTVLDVLHSSIVTGNVTEKLRW